MMGIPGLCTLSEDNYNTPDGPYPLTEFGDTFLERVDNITLQKLQNPNRGDMIVCLGKGHIISFIRRDTHISNHERVRFPVVQLGKDKSKYIAIGRSYLNSSITELIIGIINNV